jgi:hypothetical protein
LQAYAAKCGGKDTTMFQSYDVTYPVLTGDDIININTYADQMHISIDTLRGDVGILAQGDGWEIINTARVSDVARLCAWLDDRGFTYLTHHGVDYD